MILDAELRTFVQGKFSISDYCHCLKAMTDALGDLGEAVLDRTLVLAVLRGLNGRFAHMVSLLKRQRPFPTFMKVRNDMQLEEIEMAVWPGSSASVLVATTAATGHAPPFVTTPAPGPPTLSAPSK
jgi:hypothetical protein